MADIKEVIKETLKEPHSSSELKSIGMPDGEPISSYTLTYDAPSAQLEPIYFWLLDFLKDLSSDGVEKLTDNFTSSPGSGHFAEMGQRATRMQEQGMKILGMINQVVKTILNLVYDLKEFEIRLKHYEDAKSDDEKQKEAGMLALKQIWLDNVDLKRGRGSIHQMAAEMGYTTIREAFMMAKSLNDLKKMNKGEGDDEGILNDSVLRVLEPRLSEFLNWKERSEQELRKRYEIERSYLKTEVESLKLYTSWARPYLKAAEQLKQKGFESNPALVNAFNTAMFEMVLLGKSKVNFEKSVQMGELPRGFKNYKPKRDYYSCLLVGITFRGFPQKVTQQNYGFGGRVDMTFDCFALNDDELEYFKNKLRDKDIEDTFSFVEETTQKSLDEMKNDIDHFLEDKEEKKQQKQKNKEDINPFSALFGLFKSEKTNEKKEIKQAKDIKKDNYIEKYIRSLAKQSAKKSLYSIYDIYKKAHGMASSPEPFDN